MSKNGDAMKLLGQLICDFNPYTEIPAAAGSKTCTGKMCVVTDPPVLPTEASNALLQGVAIEVEENYGTQWNFKGQTQSVKTAVRIPYRFPVYRVDPISNQPTQEILYWRTEYLLIGYAGGDGPG